MYVLAILAYCVLITASTFGYVAVGNTHWTSAAGNSNHSGLFISCTEDVCIRPSPISDWLMATRAFFVLGVVCLGLNHVLMGFHIFGRPWSRCPLDKSTMELMSLALAIVGGVTELIAISIYGAKVPADHLGWPFGMATAAGVLALFGAGLLFVVRKNTTSSRFTGQ